MPQQENEVSIAYHAAVQAVSGLLLGLLMTIALFLLSDWRSIKTLHTWGNDLGMRMLTTAPFLPHTDFSTTASPFLFLDLDRKACVDFFKTRPGRTADCDDVSFPPVEFLGELVAAVSKAQAKAIILDFQLPNALFNQNPLLSAKFDAYRKILSEPAGPPVIAPLPLTPGAHPADSYLIQSRAFIEGASLGRLRLAGFLTWSDPVATDGVIRGYPPIITVTPRSERETYRFFPSAPLLAAVIAENENGTKVADALFYGNHDASSCEMAGRSRVLKNSVPDVLATCGSPSFLKASERNIPSLLFSIRSLALAPNLKSGSGAEELEARYYGSGTIEGGMLYRHIRLSSKMNPDSSDPFTELTKDILVGGMVVVIGTSAEEAVDRHATPLGRMAGSEVLINATRAFADFEPLSDSSTLLGNLANDFPASLTSALIVFFLALTSGKLRSAAEGRAQTVLALLACEVIAVVGILLALLIALLFASWQLGNPGGAGNLDILLPVTAVLFQSILEFFVRILKLCEFAADWILSHIKGGYAWLASLLWVG